VWYSFVSEKWFQMWLLIRDPAGAPNWTSLRCRRHLDRIKVGNTQSIHFTDIQCTYHSIIHYIGLNFKRYTHENIEWLATKKQKIRTYLCFRLTLRFVSTPTLIGYVNFTVCVFIYFENVINFIIYMVLLFYHQVKFLL